MARIYLDNAATSWPKPEAVYEAVNRYQREIGAAAGRGAYQSAQQAQRLVAKTRLFCATQYFRTTAGRLAFTANGTAALNLAIHGLLNPGDHVVSTVCEHNSVLRPLHWQSEHNDVQVTYVDCDEAGYVDVDQISAAITGKTRLIAVSHASNVTGAIQPIAQIAQQARNAGVLTLVDAAQTAGSMTIDLEKLPVDLLACSGHKGLLGPLGTGLLYVRSGLEMQLCPLQQGGTGVDSSAKSQPDHMPERFEAGNLNVPAIAGLGAVADDPQVVPAADAQQHYHDLTRQLLDGLAAIPEATIYGPTADQPRVGVVSCSIDGYDPQEFATALDAAAGIECRAGLHCAPRMHAALGTDALGGLVRFSPGWATTQAEINTTLDAIAALAAAPIQ
ncbi:MAG: aminotransferase class V-fold PLP-dependent enzyme [Bythopirellula sp.]